MAKIIKLTVEVFLDEGDRIHVETNNIVDLNIRDVIANIILNSELKELSFEAIRKSRMWNKENIKITSKELRLAIEKMIKEGTLIQTKECYYRISPREDA